MSIPCQAAARPVRLAALLGAAALLASCDTIIVQADDPDDPDLTVSLLQAEAHGAHYVAGTFGALTFEGLASGAPIDPSRRLVIDTLSDLHRVALLFVGEDIESGIREARGTVRVHFTCAYSTAESGLPVQIRTTAATYPVAFGTPAAPGSRTSPSGAGAAEFTLESAWRDGGCGPGRPDSQMLNMSIRYDVTAINNAGRRRPLRGEILMLSANINLDSLPTGRDQRFPLFDRRLLNRPPAETGG